MPRRIRFTNKLKWFCKLWNSKIASQPLPMRPGLKDGLLEWRSQSLYNRPEDFVFASEKLKGRKPLDLSAVLKEKIQPAFKSIGITGVGWHTFRHTSSYVITSAADLARTIDESPALSWEVLTFHRQSSSSITLRVAP